MSPAPTIHGATTNNWIAAGVAYQGGACAAALGASCICMEVIVGRGSKRRKFTISVVVPSAKHRLAAILSQLPTRLNTSTYANQLRGISKAATNNDTMITWFSNVLRT